MAEKLRPLVVIEDALLMNISQSKIFLNEFPVLAQLKATATVKPNCGGCAGRKQRAAHSVNTGQVKRALASLPTEKKQRLRQLLKAQHVRVTYMDAGGRKVQVTF